MPASLSARGQRSFTAYKTSIPEATENLYDAEVNPSGIISLALSENHLVHGPVTEYINKNFRVDEKVTTTYSGSAIGGVRFRKAMASHVNEYLKPHSPLDMRDVCIANGVTAICSMLAFILGDVGDGILLMRPIYGKFENDLEIMAQCKVLYTNMGDTDPFSKDVVRCYSTRYQQALSEGTKPRALLICNPHNPSGRCYPATTLQALISFCAEHDLHLISDELYALSVFETSDATAATFTSILSIDTTDLINPAQIHVEYGLSKDFGVPGLHVAALITKNEDVQEAFKAIGLLHAPSALSCTVGATMLEDSEFIEAVKQLSCSQLAENYAMVTTMFDSAGISYWKGGRAGFFLWIDLSPYLPPKVGGEEDEVRERMLSDRLLEVGIWLNPAAERAEWPGWFRLIFSHDKIKVEEGVKRIIKTLCGNQELKREAQG